tara:strand:+ start:2951 stop:3367 length:417 start_codon:yes stop_codon:yes gene_type:complete
MVFRTFLLSFSCLIPLIAAAESEEGEGPIDPERAANTIILDEIGVANLRIKTEEVEETDFKTTVFAIGRIQEIPAKRSALSSRIPGSIKSIEVFEGDFVKKGQVVAEVEIRQPASFRGTESADGRHGDRLTRTHWPAR